MTVAATDLGARRSARRLPLALSLALREQRNGLRGFYVFIACVALGVAVITGVGALADALRSSFERQGEALLGGDVTLSRPHRPAEGEERAWLWKQGRVSETATMRAMARRPDGSEQALIELKGVDAAYPLVGERPAVRRRVARRGDPPRAGRRHRSRSCSSGWAEGGRPPFARHASRFPSAPPSPPSPTS